MTEVKNLYEFLMRISEQVMNERGLFAILAIALMAYFVYTDHQHNTERVRLNQERAALATALLDIENDQLEVEKEWVELQKEVIASKQAILAELLEQRKLLSQK